ncbi:hypothetical protein NHQ30_000152 [Ciborinia camelliae]|nr:hypothetical protein NHQ30_000152 [Ciborinia camelliae]
MRYHSWPSADWRVAFVLFLITQSAYATSISNGSDAFYPNSTLPFSTTTSYGADRLPVLSSGAGIVTDSSKTAKLVGTTTNAIYTHSDGCIVSAVKQKGSIVIVSHGACGTTAAPSWSTSLSPTTRNGSIVPGTDSTTFSSPGINLRPSSGIAPPFSNSSVQVICSTMLSSSRIPLLPRSTLNSSGSSSTQMWRSPSLSSVLLTESVSVVSPSLSSGFFDSSEASSSLHLGLC